MSGVCVQSGPWRSGAREKLSIRRQACKAQRPFGACADLCCESQCVSSSRCCPPYPPSVTSVVSPHVSHRYLSRSAPIISCAAFRRKLHLGASQIRRAFSFCVQPQHITVVLTRQQAFQCFKAAPYFPSPHLLSIPDHELRAAFLS